MTGNVLAVIVAYLIGSLPLGLVMGKVLKGVDIRDYGSGKIGATNVMRTVGFGPALIVAAFDISKGIAGFYLGNALGDSSWTNALAALAALAGHNWSMFLKFGGGRGVNTGIGVMFVITPIWGVVALGSGIVAVGFTRYVSLGSLIGTAIGMTAITVLAATGHQPWAYAFFALSAGVIIIVQHRDNIERLVNGTERRLGQKGESRAGSPVGGDPVKPRTVPGKSI